VPRWTHPDESVGAVLLLFVNALTTIPDGTLAWAQTAIALADLSIGAGSLLFANAVTAIPDGAVVRADATVLYPDESIGARFSF